MKTEQTSIPDVIVLTPAVFGDERGQFAETWNAERMSKAGLDRTWVQDNQSISTTAGTLRGLHFQSPPVAQAKLVRCGRGAIWDVAVDIRVGSPTFGNWVGVELSAENRKQLFVPEGFAHGFVTRTSDAEVLYKASAPYRSEAEGVLRWDCPDVGINWDLPNGPSVINQRDAEAACLSQFRSPFVFEDVS